LSPTLRSRDELIKDARRAGPFRLARQEAAGLVTSFNYAFEGVIYVVRTQRNMRVHFAVALSVLPLGVALGVTRFELLALLLSVSFVLIAEMFNTALEKAIDVATNSFDPIARTAKDVAAGADTLRREVQAARFGPGQRDQILDGLGRRVRRHHQHTWEGAERRDRLEILDRIEANIGQRRHDGEQAVVGEE